ncbi:MAG: TraB/GumN family protein [Lactobacillales bacterium]|jgi:uncharacterized protein YbaP (TraB family)|nr:TraB/GumN family protein [Lactobacillales bacterium]
MKKISILISFLVLLLASCTNEDKSLETQKKEAVDWPFYEIISDDTTQGYILGSIHIGSNGWYPFPTEITDAIDNSSSIISEVKYSSAFSQNIFNYQSDADTFEKYLLNNYFSKEEKEELLEIASNYKISKLDFENTTLADFYSQLQIASLTQQEVVGGVDYRVYSYLQKAERLSDNTGFETVSEQYLLLNRSLESELQSNSNWIEIIPSYKESIKQKEQSLNNYITGDIQQMVNEDDLETLFDTKILIEERQNIWFQTLTERLNTDKKIFTVVGAAHLYGENGLLKELERAGYSIRKVDISGS